MKLLVGAALLLCACSRRAEIEDPPPEGEVTFTEPPRPDGGVPLVSEAEFDDPDGLACADRPTNRECRGSDDLPCNFHAWLQNLAELCQRRTQCTDGWVEVQVGADGCANELRMEDPDPPYVACLTEELNRYRCPCKNVVGSRYLGLDHGECNATCGTGELRCPPGSICQDGQCVEDTSGLGGATAG